MTLKVLGVYTKDKSPQLYTLGKIASTPGVKLSQHNYPPTTRREHTWITVMLGGILNDFYYFPPMPVKKNGLDYMRRRINEVNIFSKEELDSLNEKFGTDVLGGAVGENILVNGTNINYLSLNTILKIGDEVLLQVVGRRSLCGGFISPFCGNGNFTSIDYNKFDQTKIGLATQVIQSGIVKVGDIIEIIEPNEPMALSLYHWSSGKFQLHNLTDPTILPVPDLNFDPTVRY
jgi:hypothetical protein